MPPKIKLVFSVIVVLTAIAGYFFQQSLGKVWPSYAALLFGVVAVVSMWIFPEVARKKDGEPTRER